MSAKDFFNPASNTVATVPISVRVKSWVVDKATGSVLPRVIMAVTATAAAWIMQQWGTVIEKVPGLETIVDPRLVVDLVSQLIVAVALLAIAKWTGKPIRELQEQLGEAGVYYGRVDGLAGPKTQEALARAVNRNTIQIKAGKLVNSARN